MTDTPLRYLVDLNAQVLPESTDPDYTFRYIDISQVASDGTVSIPSELMRFTEAPSRARRLADSSDTVVSTVRTYLRAIAPVPDTDESLVFSTGFAVLHPRRGTDPRFLSYACRSDAFVEEVVARSVGVSYPAIAPGDLLDLTIPHPDLEEQRRIADFLDDRVARIDQIITARRQQLQLLDEEARSMGDEILRDVDAPWVRLGLFIIHIEQGWSPQCDAVPASLAEWGVLKVGAVQPGHFSPSENKRLPDHETPRREYEVRAGDLLVSRANTPERVGFFTVVPEGVRPRLILCDKIMRLDLSDELDPNYVSLVGQTRRTRDRFALAATGTSGSMVNVRGDDIRDLPIPLTPLSTQASLVKEWRVRALEIVRWRRLLSGGIALLSEYKQSLITASVSGELDVPTAGSRIPS